MPKCPACRGKSSSFDEPSCSFCRSIGSVSSAEAEEIRRRLSAPVVCGACQGVGRRAQGGIGPNGPAMGYVVCAMCGGTGFVNYGRLVQADRDDRGSNGSSKWFFYLCVAGAIYFLYQRSMSDEGTSSAYYEPSSVSAQQYAGSYTSEEVGAPPSSTDEFDESAMQPEQVQLPADQGQGAPLEDDIECDDGGAGSDEEAIKHLVLEYTNAPGIPSVGVQVAGDWAFTEVWHNAWEDSSTLISVFLVLQRTVGEWEVVTASREFGALRPQVYHLLPENAQAVFDEWEAHQE